MIRKTIKVIDKAVDRIVIVICLLFFLICLYAMFDACMVYNNANDSSVLKYKPELGHGAETLQELSEDAVAWLTVDNTNIDYPIMQGKNNDEYLNKDPFGKYSLSGSIFLDSRNDKNFNDEYSLIYGHHMEYGAMFGALDKFIDKSYFNAHRTGTLITEGGKDYTIYFFACAEAPATESVIFDPTESSNKKLLEYIEKNAAIYEPQIADSNKKILALSTCQSAETIDRMIVFGVLNEI